MYNKKRQWYTWRNPGGKSRSQIDYILVRQRYRNSVKSSQSYPGADEDSDHNLVAMRVELKLKKLNRGVRKQRKWDRSNSKMNEEAFRRGVESDVRPSNGRTAEEK